MDCNKCNTNYNRNNYNMRSTMYSESHGGIQSNMNRRVNTKKCSMDSMSEMTMDSDCNKMREHVDHMKPGMGYVPWQEWKEIYDMEKGFERGTIFCQLDKPYIGRAMK